MIYILVLIPIFSHFFDDSKDKRNSLKISIFVLFFIAAFQYKCSQDWDTYTYRWKVENWGFPNLTIQTEYIYGLLMRLAKPIGLFGFLILSAVFNFTVYYYLIRKYVPPKYYWLFFVVFTLNFNYFFLLVDTNRQTLALTCTMLAVDALVSKKYFLDKYAIKYFKKINKFVFRYLIAICFIVIAINIHTSAYAALGLLILPLIINLRIWNNVYITLLIFLGIFFIRYFLNLSEYSIYIQMFFQDQDSRFSSYSKQIENKDTLSIYSQSLYFIYYLVIAIQFRNLSRFERIASLGVLLTIFIDPFIVKDMFRAMLFYSIYLPFLIPRLLKKPLKPVLKNLLIGMVCLYCIRNFYGGINSEYYHRYQNFTTIFSAPTWV